MDGGATRGEDGGPAKFDKQSGEASDVAGGFVS